MRHVVDKYCVLLAVRFGLRLAITRAIPKGKQFQKSTSVTEMTCATGNHGRFKKCLLALLLALSTSAVAQQKRASLTVTATVQNSISLVFMDNANVGTTGFCPLTNAGTNNASLDLGSAQAVIGDSLPCVAYLLNAGGGTYDVSSAFDVLVTKANTPSPNYRLAVAISAAPPANVNWIMNALTLTTAPQTLQAANAYGRTTETLHVKVKNSVPAQVLTETIFFTATAN